MKRSIFIFNIPIFVTMVNKGKLAGVRFLENFQVWFIKPGRNTFHPIQY